LYTREVGANLGTDKTGLAGTLGYTVYDTAGSVLLPRATAGVAELGTSGIYVAAVTNWNSTWSGYVAWDAPLGTFLATSTFTPDNVISLGSDGLDNVVVESGMNARQAMSVMAAAMGGVLSGSGTTTVTILGAGVGTTRITATVDAAANRTAVTLNPPA